MQTFNCGIGFCIITSRKNTQRIEKIFPKQYKPYVIGYISKSKNQVNLSKFLKW